MLSYSKVIKQYYTGCPTSNYPASMGLKYDLGDKLENLRRMNYFEKFDKTNRIFFFARNAKFFEYYVHILALKNGDNLI